ncbi:hypothetical protein E2C01_097568 [Portunus trituberculatus]|uniref:Uncharacterized protein n=1 Tax=Portunus trituberculatus TaxID=210409 RepID=A0A5B7K625_PORTR|nr:hypothetical protein [Portunus trituberculatus]
MKKGSVDVIRGRGTNTSHINLRHGVKSLGCRWMSGGEAGIRILPVPRHTDRRLPPLMHLPHASSAAITFPAHVAWRSASIALHCAVLAARMQHPLQEVFTAYLLTIGFSVYIELQNKHDVAQSRKYID